MILMEFYIYFILETKTIYPLYNVQRKMFFALYVFPFIIYCWPDSVCTFHDILQKPGMLNLGQLCSHVLAVLKIYGRHLITVIFNILNYIQNDLKLTLLSSILSRRWLYRYFQSQSSQNAVDQHLNIDIWKFQISRGTSIQTSIFLVSICRALFDDVACRVDFSIAPNKIGFIKICGVIFERQSINFN